MTIGRAYVLAGYPDQLPSLPSFERWSDLVRSALAWLGCGDPCASMDMARAEDPIRAERTAVFTAWEAELGLLARGLTVPEMISEAEATDQSGFLHSKFREACLAVSAERSGNTISPRRLGKWLAKNNNNKVGALKLQANRADPSRVRWQLSR